MSHRAKEVGGDWRGENDEQLVKKGVIRENIRAIGDDRKEPMGDKDTGKISK